MSGSVGILFLPYLSQVVMKGSMLLMFTKKELLFVVHSTPTTPTRQMAASNANQTILHSVRNVVMVKIRIVVV